MSKTVFLHIGLSKTGTSSIQLVLRANDDALAKQGIAYPGVRENPEYGRFGNHRALLVALGGQSAARATREDPQRCQALVASTVASFVSDDHAKTLVWSHESLAGLAQRWDFSFLEQAFGDLALKLILYVRYLDDWLESQYRQLLWSQSLRPVDTISREDLLAVDSLCRRWLRNINPLTVCNTMSERMPRAEVVLRSFDAVRSGDRLVVDFLDIIGAEQHDRSEKKLFEHPTNLAPPTADIALLRDLWQSGAEPSLIRDVAGALERTTRAAKTSLEDVALRFVPEGIAGEARALYAATAKRFPHLPVQPESAPSASSEGNLRERLLARLATAQSAMSEKAYHAASEALR